jgi:hypothetical protein
MGCRTLILYVVVLSCVVWRILAAEVDGNVTQPLNALEVGRKYSKKQLAAITKNFVNYYLHFGCKEGTSCGHRCIYVLSFEFPERHARAPGIRIECLREQPTLTSHPFQKSSIMEAERYHLLLREQCIEVY